MRNLFALVGLLVVGFACVGWYCGWYKLKVGKSDDGKLQIETKVDTHKVAEDSSSFFQRVGKMAGEQMEKNNAPAAAPGATPGPGASQNTTKEKDSFSGGWLLSPTQPTRPTAGNR